MKLKSTGQLQRIAILIREPRHLLRNSAGTPLGAQLAQERLLKVHVLRCPVLAPVVLLGPGSWLRSGTAGRSGTVGVVLCTCTAACLSLSRPGLPTQPHAMQAAGWQVVPLEAQCCLCLPVRQLSEELGALMMRDGQASSLRFLA